MSTETPDVEPPDAVLVNRRWIPRHNVEWAKACDAIMRQHGAVTGSQVYAQRHKARWRARKLMDLMDQLGIHQRWQLREHIDRKDGGWIWTVEYLQKEKA